MRYRAILVTDEKLPRAVQSFSNDIEGCKEWAKKILKGRAETDKVQIWETQERLVANVWPEEEKK